MTENSDYTAVDRDNHVKTYFGGDTKKFNESLLDSHRNRYQFNDLSLAEQIHPEHIIEGKKLIEYLLGYLPPDTYTIKQEPFLRLLHESYINGKIDLEQMLTDAEEHVKLIREFDMLPDCGHGYERHVYKEYFEYIPELADKAKQRLIEFLGYEPWLEASVEAEMLLREAMADERFRFTGNINTVDMQAITKVHYREMIIAHGIAAANSSPLIACGYRTKYPFDPEKEKI